MGIRDVVFQRIIPGVQIRGGRVGRGGLPNGWANTAAAILYQYQFARNGGVVFTRETLEQYGHVQNVNHMDRLRTIYLSYLFTQMAAHPYTVPEAQVVCYLLHDVAEVMFLEKLRQDVLHVMNAGGVLMQPWQQLEVQIMGLLLQAKAAVRRHVLQCHNNFGFSRATLCYASFSMSQVNGRPNRMGPHGYAGSIYFQNGRIRLIHATGPTASFHLNPIRTVTNGRNVQENVIVEPQDNQVVLNAKTCRIQNARIYEYDPAHLAMPIPVNNGHVAGPPAVIGRRVMAVPQFGWDKLELSRFARPFHHSRGVPRKINLTNQQIETLFFLGDGIHTMRGNLPAGAQNHAVVEAGNKLVLEYIDMSVGLRQSLGYG